MSKTDKLWSKWASLGGLKASLKRWSCIIFFTDVPFLTYFLQRKIDGIILSWVLKIYQKMLKISEYETFQSFSSIFGDIGCICFQKLFVFKNYQNFQMYNLWMSTILGHFRPFGRLLNYWVSIEKPSHFLQILYPMHVFYREKFWMVVSYRHSKNFSHLRAT